MAIPISPEYRYFDPRRYLDRRQAEWAAFEACGLISYVYDEDPRTAHPAMVRVSAELDTIIGVLDEET